MRERLRRNLTGKFLGEFGARLVAFAFNLVLARGLGADGFGRYGYAYAFAGTLALCGELGLNTLLIREAARDRDRAAGWIRAFAPLRWASVAAVALATGALALAHPDRSRALEIGLMAVFMAGNTALDYHTAVFTAFERMGHDAGFRVATRLLVSGAGIAAVALGAPLLGVLAAVAGGNLMAVAAGWVWRRRTGLTFGVCWDPAFMRRALLLAVPTAAAWIANTVYFYMDNLVLSALGASDAAVGQYAAAAKVLDASQALPLIAVGGLFPVVAELSRGGEARRLAPFFGRVARLSLLLGAPLAAVAATASPFVAQLLFGPGYRATGPALALLALCAPLYAANLVALFLLLAAGRPWVAAGFRLASAGLKALLMVVGFRWFGALAAALAMLVADAALYLGLLAWRSRAGLAEPGEWGGVLRVAGGCGVALAFWFQTRPLFFVAQAAAVAAGFLSAYAMLGLLPRARPPTPEVRAP